MAEEVYAIPDYAMWLGTLAIAGIATSYNIDNRLQALEARVVLPKDHSDLIALLKGERHKPEHKQPESLAAGGALVSWIRPAHEILFEDFRWFAAVMNQNISDPWAVEELHDTDIHGYSGPEIGRK
ncbi:hypothetical protein QA646_19850 (plasmid) [Rhizobium sp. CB3090]|uniref:hypothetical protein n=1 Tax=Rhizobium sp. CB3090 TaxID=3039156 RepID=UPI0024B21336|nr:hypothetical protein [Rhizobium sp. CB3090]WFU12186.1 hypothetical protein QA646_19850 [Rhizobium sp. CB3090]